MEKILIIGDSHTLRLRNSFGDHIEQSPDCTWGLDENGADLQLNSQCFQNHSARTKGLKKEVYFSGHRGKTGYRGSYFDKGLYPCLNKFKNDEFTILSWFGYIDVKQFLPLDHCKNPEEAVDRYVKQTLNFFSGNKIRFIEPLPQFINALGSGQPLFDFESRKPYQDAFIYHLREQSRIHGLEDPISISSILGVEDFDESFECHECRDCLDPQYSNFKLDHPKEQHFRKILDSILTEYNCF